MTPNCQIIIGCIIVATCIIGCIYGILMIKDGYTKIKRLRRIK